MASFLDIRHGCIANIMEPVYYCLDAYNFWYGANMAL